MLCPCLGRLLFRPNSLILQCKAFVSTINENILSSLEMVPESSRNCDTKLLKVAVIGMPNAGKSTFINGIMDRKRYKEEIKRFFLNKAPDSQFLFSKVCAASPKVHTTRTKAKAIFTSEDTQIIFIDTPGLVNDREQKKFNLHKAFAKDSKAVSQESDIIGVIHDVSNIWGREKLDIKIVNILEKHRKKPSFLVLNKVDILKSKRKLLDITKVLTESSVGGKPIGTRKLHTKEDCENRGWPYFSDIFMVSALTGDGLDDIKSYLIDNAKPGEWMYPEEIWTDQNAESVITNTVKAALLNCMPQEIPYKLHPVVEYFKIDEATGKVTTVVLIQCPTSRLVRLVSGASDGRLRQITETVQKDLQSTFQNFVKIQIIPTLVESKE